MEIDLIKHNYYQCQYLTITKVNYTIQSYCLLLFIYTFLHYQGQIQELCKVGVLGQSHP